MATAPHCPICEGSPHPANACPIVVDACAPTPPATRTDGKRRLFTAMLHAYVVEVVFDVRASGVIVPDHLRHHDFLRFDYGLNMPVPINDIDVGSDAIRATLSFNRKAFGTVVPWPAIVGIGCTDVHVTWPQDVAPLSDPPRLTAHVDPKDPSRVIIDLPVTLPPTMRTAAPKPRHLRLVK